jgi:hypothetical protein
VQSTTSYDGCVMVHHVQGVGGDEQQGMVGVGGGERGVAITGNAWGSGGQVGDAHPAMEGTLKECVGHGEGGPARRPQQLGC